MSTNGDVGNAAQRVGDAERQAAMGSLNEHWQAGRLDPAEHERRTTAAYSAVTQGDLDALFADLPGGGPRPGAMAQDVTAGVSPAPTSAPRPSQGSGGGGVFGPDSWVGQHRDTVMGVTPFVALALFFATKWWVFFLLIPAMGVLLYTGDGDPRVRQARRRARDERRSGD